MCGRFTLKTPVANWLADLFPNWDSVLARQIEALPKSATHPRYNIAPTQPILSLSFDASNYPTIETVRWGLVPVWADSLSAGYNMINARLESIADKPSFRPSVIDKRCVVLADGYYEWKTVAPKVKEPYWIHTEGEHVFAMAGLWAENRKIQHVDGPIRSATIVTAEGNSDVAHVHDRMPCILTSEMQIANWLNPNLNNVQSIDALLDQLQPRVTNVLKVRPVSTLVNHVANQGEQLLQPLAIFPKWQS
jgi:putative SOS response-associated peptidase YedK